MYLGVDGCPAGWITIRYDGPAFLDSVLYPDIETLWADNRESVDRILIDVPIGLREDSNAKRRCDADARRVLQPIRNRSVFPPPVRPAVHEDTYQAAKAEQESRTTGSLSTQSWSISDKIAELDTFLTSTQPNARNRIRESHPELCFWAFNNEQAMTYSKTRQPAAAFWERIDVLETIDTDVLRWVRNASSDLDADVGLDDIIDAFALALTASPRTEPHRTLPEDGTETDREGLPMEMLFATTH